MMCVQCIHKVLNNFLDTEIKDCLALHRSIFLCSEPCRRTSCIIIIGFSPSCCSVQLHLWENYTSQLRRPFNSFRYDLKEMYLYSRGFKLWRLKRVFGEMSPRRPHSGEKLLSLNCECWKRLLGCCHLGNFSGLSPTNYVANGTVSFLWILKENLSLQWVET